MSTQNTSGDITPFSIPSDMLIDVTNRCNHSCIFCPHHKTERRQGEINPSLLQRILGEAYGMGVRRVGLYTTGEMFMCKDIAAHIRTAKELGYEYIYADTNGALASRENMTKVINAGLHSIKFSINAGKRETYSFIHGQDDFDKVIDNLKTCHELKKTLSPKLKIMVSFIVTKQTEEEVAMLKDIIDPFIDVFVAYPVIAHFPQDDDDISYLKTDKYGASGFSIPCSMVFNRIHVTYDGFLSACCIDFEHDLLLADLNVTPLKEAWVCENAIDFRKRHLSNQLDGIMCYGCVRGEFSPYAPLKTIHGK